MKIFVYICSIQIRPKQLYNHFIQSLVYPKIFNRFLNLKERHLTNSTHV